MKQPFVFVAQAAQITAIATRKVWLVPSVRGPAYFTFLESSFSQSRMLSISSIDLLAALSLPGLRGALSFEPKLHRFSFSTDLLQELEVIFGGENNLEKALFKLIEEGLALVFDNWKNRLMKGPPGKMR